MWAFHSVCVCILNFFEVVFILLTWLLGVSNGHMVRDHILQDIMFVFPVKTKS